MSLAERNDPLTPDSVSGVSRAPRDLCCEIGCTNPPRRPGQRLCKHHHTEQMRAWRKNRAKVEARVADLEILVVDLRSEVRELRRLIAAS